MCCVAEKEFPSGLVNGMIRYLNDKYPIPGKTVVFRPLKQVKLNRSQTSLHNVGAGLVMTDTPVITALVCVGTTKAPAEDYVQIRRVAHEYRHALQVYKEGKKYSYPVDKELEKDAWEFAHEACRDLMKEARKYIFQF